MRALGFTGIVAQDLTKKYLGPGCTAPKIFELWIGKNDTLDTDGKHGSGH